MLALKKESLWQWNNLGTSHNQLVMFMFCETACSQDGWNASFSRHRCQDLILCSFPPSPVLSVHSLWVSAWPSAGFPVTHGVTSCIALERTWRNCIWQHLPAPPLFPFVYQERTGYTAIKPSLFSLAYSVFVRTLGPNPTWKIDFMWIASSLD